MEIEGNTKSDTATTEPTRIFVGGLGENVSENDVEKIFSSLSVGEIEGIEIIRTKGRSFAYFNMVPSSDKSLAKLFSTYNGCKWKGGQLKLEKAKEHYLNRLKREWEDDEAQAIAKAQAQALADAEVPILKSTEISNNGKSKPKKFVDPKDQEKLKIFFPKLGKVKSLPLSGTGKHKYSFQRPKVQSAPLHFCDCEEHAIPDHALVCGKGKNIHNEEVQIGGMNEEEINLMGSVMKKLFERENSSKKAIVHTGNKTEVPNRGDFDVKSTDNLQADENEPVNTEDQMQPDVSDDEEDNLVLNLGSKSNDIEAILGSWSQKPISNAQNLGSKRGSKSGPVRKATQEVTGNIAPKKKSKTRLSEENDRKAPVLDNGNSQIEIDEAESAMLLEVQPILPESGVKQVSAGVSSSKKSSWKALVGDNKTSKSSFSVSDLLTNTNKEELPKSDSSNDHDSCNSKKKLKKRKTSEEKSEETEVEPAEVATTNTNKVEVPISDSSNIDESSISKKKKLRKPRISEEKSEKSKVEPPEVVTTNKSTEGSGWFQKSPWTQMVDENNNSFSITQILPSVTFEKLKVEEPVTVATPSETNDNYKTDPANNILTSSGHEKEGNVKNLSVENRDTVVGNAEASNLPSVVREHDVSETKTSISDISIGETCTFMRSDASMKEWSSIKAALNRSNKRQSGEKK